VPTGETPTNFILEKFPEAVSIFASSSSSFLISASVLLLSLFSFESVDFFSVIMELLSFVLLPHEAAKMIKKNTIPAFRFLFIIMFIWLPIICRLKKENLSLQ
jgi:hypothetical protein